MQAILEKLVASIQGAILKLDPSGPSIGSGAVSQEVVIEACSYARSILGDYAPWHEVESNLVSTLDQFDEFDRLILEGSLDNELDLLCKLSTAKCHVGTAQSCLLCPSPVDPVVTVRTKHQCLQQQVSHLLL